MLLRRRARSEGSGPRFVLSLALALLTGFISGILTLIVYATGILPSGGVLDPLRLIEDANHPPGAPLLVAWTIARDLLPAGLAGLFLACRRRLQRLYAAERPPEQKSYSWEESSNQLSAISCQQAQESGSILLTNSRVGEGSDPMA